MRILVTRLRNDKKREKVLATDWPDPPSPAANQVKTKTLYSGLTNGTERNDLLGGNYAHPDEALPAPWGYQNVGEVVEIGPEIKNLAVGDVVYSSADHVEYALFDEHFLYCKLPPEVDRKEAALFGMTSVAMRTCRHADIRLGERVLIVGAGIIGQTAAQIANLMGGRVSICDINRERVELARQIGAAEQAIDVSGDGWKEHIADASYEAIIDVAGVPGMEDKLILAATPRGRILFIAGRDKVSYTFNIGQGREITIQQNSHFDNSDLANLCRLVARGQVKLSPYVREVVPVSKAKDIYDTLRDTPDALLGTVFVW
jgi:2-desacetyl-2-hydroxyethyl bacteriochlorophyllide A dehydrogenase